MYCRIFPYLTISKYHIMKKYILLTACCFFSSLLVFNSKAFAQSLSSDDVKAQLITDWERAKAYTIDYLNKMPADKYSFKAVDSIRSFAQQMLHLAQGNVFLMSMAADDKKPSWADSNLEGSTTAASKDSVMYYVTSSYDYCAAAVKNMPVSKWGEKKKIFGSLEATRFGLLLKTFEHQTHHRGQTTIYIRLQGIRPPDERLF
jgi:uncharacterized damage-inducible protein DinB